jgi:hypothetical protein
MSLIKELVKATGKLNIEIKGPDGKVKESVYIPNLVVTTGKNFIANRMKDTVSGFTQKAQMSHMAVGISNTAPNVADTTLADELARVALTTAGGSVASAVVTYAATFNPGTGTGAIVEAGIFNDDGTPGGDMLCRTTFAVVNKGADDTMSITWTVTIS